MTDPPLHAPPTAEPTHDPPPAPSPPSPAPQPRPSEPDPGGEPAHDPPVHPERGLQGGEERAQRRGGAGAPGSHEQVQQTLDDALADSFPASDPVSIVTSQHEECWDEQCRDSRATPAA